MREGKPPPNLTIFEEMESTCWVAFWDTLRLYILFGRGFNTLLCWEIQMWQNEVTIKRRNSLEIIPRKP